MNKRYRTVARKDNDKRFQKDDLNGNYENRSAPSVGGKRRNRNVETNIVSIIFIAIFAVMVIYMVNFNNADAARIADSPYNQRVAKTTQQENPVRRGAIYSNDGSLLAMTDLNEDTSERRVYPYGALFAAPIGMARGGGSGLEGGMYDDLGTATNKTEVLIKSKDHDKTEYQGDNVFTTLDVDLQQVAYDALGDEKGAVVAVEPSTGKILCMVSKPSYDPNLADTEYNTWANLSADDSVLINRAAQGAYPPGSTFKVLTALEYVKEHPKDYEKFAFNCTGTIHPVGGAEIHCINKIAHGQEDLTKAFVVSCNCAFSTIGTDLDMNKFRATAESMGLNSTLPIEIDNYKSTFNLNDKSEMSEIQETSFGQGRTLITPLQNLMITATVANGGTMMKPYMVEKVQATDGTIVRQFAPVVYNANVATEEEAGVVKKLMREMVSQSLYGIFGSAYSVCGKTGTAEFTNNSDRAHMWFTCFAPYKNPRIAVIAICEKSEIDPTKAPKICKKVLDAYFNKY